MSRRNGAVAASFCVLLLAAIGGCERDRGTSDAARETRVTVEVREGPREAIEFRREGSAPATAVLTPGGDGKLRTQVGIEEDGHYRSTGRAGFLQFGPYATLPAGHYRVAWIGRVQSAKEKAAASADVVHDTGRAFLAGPVAIDASRKDSTLAALDFSLPRETNLIEFRLAVAEGTLATVERVEITQK